MLQTLAIILNLLVDIAILIVLVRMSRSEHSVSGLRIYQILGGYEMSIKGVTVGQSGVFSVSPVPAGSGLQAGAVPTWETGDKSVTLTPSSDGLTCKADVATNETLPSFGLTCKAVSSDGTALVSTATVPVLAAVVPATGLSIDQVS